MAKLGSFATARSNIQTNLAQLWVLSVIYPIVQYMDGDIWALGPTWMLTLAAPHSLKQQLYAWSCVLTHIVLCYSDIGGPAVSSGLT